MHSPPKAARNTPVVMDWMSGVQSLLPPIDFDSPHDRARRLSAELQEDQFISPPDLTNDSLSGSLPLGYDDDSFLNMFSFDQDTSYSEGSHAVSPLTQSDHRLTRSSEPTNDQHYSPRPRRRTTAGTQEKEGQDLRCWDHGCNGQVFTTLSNLKRHKREKSSKRPSYPCSMCGAIFSRTTARNHHIQNQSCNRIRRHSNGRQRVSNDWLGPS